MNTGMSSAPLLGHGPWNMMMGDMGGVGMSRMGMSGMGMSGGGMSRMGMGGGGMSGGGMGGSRMGESFGGMMSSFGSMESVGSSSNKILRLDATGSYHVDTSNRRDKSRSASNKTNDIKPRSLLDL